MDVSKQAQKEGIELPVMLTTPLVQRLVPNSFLASIYDTARHAGL
jgi:hypothetical protein